ncbi:phosphoglycerate dehydrogenase [Christensenella minuta]|nr:phosphoglycerate dehydrogenase [Christensenella minuta]AYH39551.1 phosphoglycerate dehydrogenase [Christensenella minuta]MDY3751748.1 phosphoglycerate dehydrogenase [Christensenella minuta]OAQ38060.1 phosphoglycerate dehydrogenase [Christensenella minuta]
MKILVTPTSFLKPENAAAKAKLEAFADEVVYNDLGRPLQAEEILERLDGVDGYVAGLDYITADVLSKAPDSLKVISRYGAGVDRVDMPAATAKGIKVTNTPGTNSVAVCELAFALMLCAARNIPKLHAAVEKGEWPRSQGIELRGKTLGIVGMGAIGKNLATRAKAFGMTVNAYDPYFDEAFAKENGIGRMDLDEVLTTSDFISLHVPLNDSTRHMIDAEKIAEMKDGAVVINTARGGIIDEQAAADAVKSGKLGGLGLDAFEQEPLIESPLKGLDNVIFTPHTGAHTAEAVSGMGSMAVDNVIAVLSGENCPYVLNK